MASVCCGGGGGSTIVRTALGADAYGRDERDAFYRTIARLAALIARQGVIALVAATAPRRGQREMALDDGRFIEVCVRASRAECEARDVKGLYAAAHCGDIATLPGIGVPYEPPEAADVIAEGGFDEGAVDAIVRLISSQADEHRDRTHFGKTGWPL